MKRITEIIISSQEPNKENLWLNNGVLKYYSPKGWKPVNTKDSIAYKKLLEVEYNLRELSKDHKELKKVVDEIDDIFKNPDRGKIGQVLTKTEEGVEWKNSQGLPNVKAVPDDNQIIYVTTTGESVNIDNEQLVSNKYYPALGYGIWTFKNALTNTEALLDIELDNSNIISKIILPDSGDIEEISDGTFNDWKKLEYVNIPDSCRRIGKSAFANSGIREIYSQAEIIDERAFSDSAITKYVIINDVIVSIYADAFNNCGNLSVITNANGEGINHITLQGPNVFDDCSCLKGVPMIYGFIPRVSFRNCVSLESVVLINPKITVSAFSQCWSLKSIAIYRYSYARMPLFVSDESFEEEAEEVGTINILNTTKIYVEDDRLVSYKERYPEMAKFFVPFTGPIASVDLMAIVTHEELTNLRDKNSLISGMWYRITDYQCTTTQEYTRAANHQFDILVLATSANTLSEEARAILHEGDDYFSKYGAKLEAWKIWYCLDNDRNRFTWADTNSGKGVIYRMIDEWNNDCPYDFKNIQFERWALVDIKSKEEEYDEIANEMEYDFMFENSGMRFHIPSSYYYEHGHPAFELVYDNTNTDFYYTFSAIDQNGSILDVSIYDGAAFNNKIYSDGYQNQYWLGDNILAVNGRYLSSCISNNVLESNCEFNTIFGQEITGIRLGYEVRESIIYFEGGLFDIGPFNSYNIFYGYNITTGVENESNVIIGGNVILKGECWNNIINNGFNIKLGSSCYGNIFRENCEDISFGNNCGGTIIGYYCNKITLEDEACIENLPAYSECIKVKTGTTITFSDAEAASQTQNIRKLNIDITGGSWALATPILGQDYEITYGLNSAGEVKYWNPADLGN